MSATSVSVVATVLNEYGSLPGWLNGLAAQTRLPDECLIVDGGSTDGTLELLSSTQLPFPIRILSAPGANISTGRNIGIASASGDVVAITDAGTVAEPDWLASLIAPFELSPNVDVSAGFFRPETPDRWTYALAAATLPDAEEIDEDRFLPSSRSVAVRRRWFEAGFSYPEWLDYCEDLVFDLQLRRAGARQVTARDAIVRFMPRRGPRSFFRQYYAYARGDGKAGLFFARHCIRYASYGVAALIVARRRPRELGLLALAGAAHLLKVFKRIRRRSRESRSGGSLGSALALATAQIVLGDVAKMLGYPAGLLWRVRRDGNGRLWKTGWQQRTSSGDLPRSAAHARETRR